MTDESEQAWVLAALKRYERPLLRFAATIVGYEHAPDVVQDTFLRLCRQDRRKVEGHLAPWLFTVCRNRAVDVLRQRERLSPLEADVHQSVDSAPGNGLERKEQMSQVLSCVQQLPERQREAVALKFSGGLSYKQIAEVMELSVTNVGFILHTAIKTIRERLSDAEAIAQPAVRRAP